MLFKQPQISIWIPKTSFFYTSLLNPGSVYEYDLETNETSTLKVREVLGEYNEADYVSKRLWVEVRDGTKVPVSLVHKKGIAFDGSNPTLLYAYGSYGYSMDATFSSNRLSLLTEDLFLLLHISEEVRKWEDHGTKMENY